MKNLLLFLSLFLLAFSSCEKEEITTDEINEIPEISQEKAGGICILENFIAPAHVFDFCTGEYVFQGELRLVNQDNGFHYIQAFGKCHKLGDPDNLIDIAEMQVKIAGSLRINCETPIDVQVPSDYNTNLIMGQVPFSNSCFGCGSVNAIVTYSKSLTYLFLNDFPKAHFYFKIEDCGEEYDHFMTVAF